MFNFNLQFLIDALPIMGKGMLGIFIVTAVIILCVTGLNYFTSSERKAKKAAKKNANTNQTN